MTCKRKLKGKILCFLDFSSLCNLVNKTNLVYNLFLVYLSLVYLSNSTYFGRLCAHHQEEQMCLCDTWYLLFCVDDSLVCWSICSCIPDCHAHRITSTKYHTKTVVPPDGGHIVGETCRD